MKPALKRIEEALNQLEQSKHTACVQPSPSKNRPFSFEIFRTAPQSDFLQREISNSNTQLAANKAPELPNFITQSDTNARQNAPSDREINLPLETTADTAPETFHLHTESDSDAPSDARSDREINSVPQTQTDIDDATKLEQVVHQIQDIYHEGPIVNAWLEYYPPAPEPSAEPLREISFERPMENAQTVSLEGSREEICELPGASYLLCGIDEFGQQWSYPCPLDQLPTLSMAIARYHKLQQLLQQKHQLETTTNRNDEC